MNRFFGNTDSDPDAGDKAWDREKERDLENWAMQTAILQNNTDMLQGIIDQYKGAAMKEPTPEDMSYLSNENLEWCAAYYFTELCKRNLDAADNLLSRFEHIWMDQQKENQRNRLPSVHRQSA
jgi:hypothetical protein